jgi:hypothetical protein
VLETSQLVYHHKNFVQNEAGLETAAAAASSAADHLIKKLHDSKGVSYVMLTAEVSQGECLVVSVRKKSVQLQCQQVQNGIESSQDVSCANDDVTGGAHRLLMPHAPTWAVHLLPIL